MCKAVYCLFNHAICQSDGMIQRQPKMMEKRTKRWFVAEIKILKYYLRYLMLHSQFQEGTSHLEVTCVNAPVKTQYFVQYTDV